MKKLSAFLLSLLLPIFLTACSCKHQWTDANCIEPKTCMECGETNGEATGHSWINATCEIPKTCSSCALTEGEALGHNWQEATTEAPKTCLNCAATEGERIITDARFTTSSCSILFGNWSGQIVMPASSVIGGDIEDEIVYDVVFIFNNDGTMVQKTTFNDWESVKLLFVDTIIGNLYLEFAFMGLDGPAAEEEIMNRYGMTMEEYALAYLDSIDINANMGEVPMVYYVEGDFLIVALAWDDEKAIYKFSLDGDTLTLTHSSGDTIILTKNVE